MNALPWLAALSATALCCACSRTPLTTAALFADGMVLQRDTTAPMWGRCEPGQQVRVRASWLARELTTLTDLQGVWVVHLPTSEASGPHTITVRGGGELQLDDVWLGEVWLCGGGADMEWRVAPGPGGCVPDAEQRISAADPLVRQFEVENSLAVFPQPDCAGAWTVATPQTVGAFSSTAYGFALELRRELGVAVGVVNATYPGARAQAWLGEFHVRANVDSVEGADTIDAVRATGFELSAEQRAGVDPLFPAETPTLVYNAMVAPLAPLALRGFLWREGESDLDRAGPYHQYQRTLIQCWRDLWCGPQLPFYFVQLPPRSDPSDASRSATVRDGQRRALSLPHTGLVVASDLGALDGPDPRCDLEVGRRLALWALARDYGRSNLTPSGPIPRSIAVDGARLRIEFDHAEGLRARSGALIGFQLAGADNTFVPAEAFVDGESVVLANPAVSEPRAARYAFAAPDHGNLTNRSGLPAATFRVVVETPK